MEDDLKIPCAHYDGGSIRVKGRCTVHKDQELRVCRNCQRLYKRDPNICLAISGCQYSEQIQDTLDKSEYHYMKNDLFKSAFISLKAFVCQPIYNSQEEKKEKDDNNNENQILQNGFNFLSLEDWFLEQDEYVERKMIRDKRNVLALHSVWEKLTMTKVGEVNTWIGDQNAFSHMSEIPQHFQCCQINSNNILISGGVFEVYGNDGQLKGLQSAEDTFIIHFYAQQYDVYFDCKRVVGSDNKPVLMNQPRVGHQLVQANGNVYAIGGNNEYEYYNSCEMYNQQQKQWVEIPPLPQQPRSRFISIVKDDIVEINGQKIVQNQFIYVIGGYSKFDGSFNNQTIDKYDVKEKSWTSLQIKKSLKSKIISAGGWGFVYPGDNNMYVVGGVDKTKQAQRGVYRLEEKQGKVTFTLIGELHVARADIKGIITQHPSLRFKNQGEQVQEDKNNKQFQIVIYGGCSGDDKSTVEYFVIRNGKLENHQIQDAQSIFGPNDWPDLFQSSSIIPIGGFKDYA